MRDGHTANHTWKELQKELKKIFRVLVLSSIHGEEEKHNPGLLPFQQQAPG